MYPATFAAATPDKPAVVMSDTGATLTYAELDEHSIRLAQVLPDAGLRPGDDVALLAGNGVATYVVCGHAQRPLPDGDQPAPQAAVSRASNWGTTGHVGHLDDDGFLYLTDRKAFMIISGGVNIYPQEIENALTLHPSVLDLAVIGVPDDEMGEQVRAVVQPAPGVAPGPELERDLLEFLRERIAHFKVPRSVDFVTELPRTATGKLQKHKISEGYGV